MQRRIILAVILLAAVIAGIRVAIVARDFDATVTAQSFDELRDNLTELRAFLQRMPKGGDLHTHLSGAVYAERLIALAEQEKLCVRASDLSIVDPPCEPDKGTAPIAEAMRDQSTYDRLVNSLSMRFFLPSPATPSGHDQFFATFGRFGSAADKPAEMTVDQLRHYQAENVQYAEFMMTFLSGRDRRALAETIKGQTDFAAMLAALKANGLDRIVADMRKGTADQIARVDALLDCGGERGKARLQRDLPLHRAGFAQYPVGGDLRPDRGGGGAGARGAARRRAQFRPARGQPHRAPGLQRADAHHRLPRPRTSRLRCTRASSGSASCRRRT